MRRGLLGAAVVALVLAACGSNGSTRVADSGPVVSRAAGPDATGTDGTAAFTTGAQSRPTTPQAGLPPAAKASGVQGTVTAGPTCPVERADQPCPPRPVETDIVARDSTGATAGTTRSRSDGTYAMSLAPGYYELEVPSTDRVMQCAVATVTVEPGRTARADINCDTGIR